MMILRALRIYQTVKGGFFEGVTKILQHVIKKSTSLEPGDASVLFWSLLAAVCIKLRLTVCPISIQCPIF